MKKPLLPSFIPALALSLVLSLSMTGCKGNNAREILGLGKKSPDEFRVVSRPPLTVPQDFALRPPEEGEETTNLPAADSQARAAITGEGGSSASGYDSSRKMGPAETAVGVVSSYDLQSSADSTFLDNVGAVKADPEIRSKLYKDRVEIKKAKDEEIGLDWLSSSDDEDEVLVDAEAEKERIKDNKKTGKKVTEGETPTLEKKPKGLLQGLFN